MNDRLVPTKFLTVQCQKISKAFQITNIWLDPTTMKPNLRTGHARSFYKLTILLEISLFRKMALSAWVFGSTTTLHKFLGSMDLSWRIPRTLQIWAMPSWQGVGAVWRKNPPLLFKPFLFAYLLFYFTFRSTLFRFQHHHMFTLFSSERPVP